ncbi:MAG TPA: amidase [Actinophytocola sp.]|uniref:amidase n=1 Tax=Actinophytocola sp. TaxID=1872138 RepID=UPI002DDCB84F|nr:amidase [Actinophytocola sp.]HEV2780462.1 amidase [Actinophytocola sp.]
MLGFNLDRATIPALHRRMSRGALTAVALTEAYLERIRTLDGSLHSVLTVNRSARAQAAASDRRRRDGRSRGPLDGIPVLLKDNMDTTSMPTTAGSRALLAEPPARDATLVRRLRAAGAVILGKANLSEWANFRSAGSTSGWSGVGGQTANPHVLDRNPCGSSSGSAVAVAASLTQVAIGSETDGSIVCPAGVCGVVGHKPSLGLVSRAGMIPVTAEQDTAGPMARHVVDAAITLSVLQGRDRLDPATSAYPADQPTDYAALLRPDALRGARIGRWRLDLGPAVGKVVSEVVRALRGRGATVVEVDLPYQDELDELEYPTLFTEFHRDIDAYLATRTGVPRTLAELIGYNRSDPLEQTCFPGQDLFDRSMASAAPDDPTYLRQRARLTTLARRSIDEVLTAHRLDAIVAPSCQPAWVSNCATGDGDIVASSTPAAAAGYPAVSVPAGFTGPLPVGITFMSTRWADARVLALAADFERATTARRPPRFLPTLPA